jgi:hypothetical protein
MATIDGWLSSIADDFNIPQVQNFSFHLSHLLSNLQLLVIALVYLPNLQLVRLFAFLLLHFS